MSTLSVPAEQVRVHPPAGCGTLESPWTGWEDQLDPDPARPGSVEVVFPSGFYGVTRPARVAAGVRVQGDPADGAAWFLPADPGAEPLDSLFLVDGTGDVEFGGICLNGREGGTRSGIRLRCGTRIQVRGCRFGDFRNPDGAALLIDGESEDRYVREIVVQDCRFVHGAVGIRLGRFATDLLVADNRFEEFSGPATLVAPGDAWTDYSLIYVKNRLLCRTHGGAEPFLRILPGAEGIRLAENSFEGPDTEPAPDASRPGAVEIRGGGPLSCRRLEFLLNRIVGVPGPGLVARLCGPGFQAVGNHLVACGGDGDGALDLAECHGALVEDNEIAELGGSGIRVRDCSQVRVNGNEVTGTKGSAPPRQGQVGILVTGDGSRRVRVTDNRITGVRREGIRVDEGRTVRLTGNEVQDCGEGIRVARLTNLVLVGNDCRDNSGGGISVEPAVTRGLVALNHSILNGPHDLEILGSRVRCHSNKVDQTGDLT